MSTYSIARLLLGQHLISEEVEVSFRPFVIEMIEIVQCFSPIIQYTDVQLCGLISITVIEIEQSQNSRIPLKIAPCELLTTLARFQSVRIFTSVWPAMIFQNRTAVRSGKHFRIKHDKTAIYESVKVFTIWSLVR